MEKMKRNELVEPKKPIVFYIDPATPKQWVPYLIQGVNDWQVAFEKAGLRMPFMLKSGLRMTRQCRWRMRVIHAYAIWLRQWKMLMVLMCMILGRAKFLKAISVGIIT